MAYAHEEQRVLVTRDKGFLQLCREEHPHSGVVYWPHGRSTKSSDMQALLIELLQQIVKSPAHAAEISPPTSGLAARSVGNDKPPLRWGQQRGAGACQPGCWYTGCPVHW